MAEKEKKEKQKKKKGKGLLVAILAPLLIVLLISNMFFAILNGLVEIIKGIVSTLADIVSRPLDYLKAGWGNFTNWLSTHVWDGDFDPRSLFSEKK